jgi:hypothetical protein
LRRVCASATVYEYPRDTTVRKILTALQTGLRRKPQKRAATMTCRRCRCPAISPASSSWDSVVRRQSASMLVSARIPFKRQNLPL